MVHFWSKVSISSILLVSLICSFYLSSCASIDNQDVNNALGLVETVLSSEHKEGSQEVVQSSSDKKQAKLLELNDDVIGMIASYLSDPVYTFGSLNKRYYALFHDKLTRKHYVMQRFNIPELSDVDGNEPELLGILGLSWSAEDPFLVFASLMEDVSKEKRPYKNILLQLIAYFQRSFQGFSVSQRSDFLQYLELNFVNCFNCQMGQICRKNEFYALALEFFREANMNMMEVFITLENRKALYEVFKANHDASAAIQETFRFDLIHENMNKYEIMESASEFRWIAECVIYDVPEVLYRERLEFRPITLVYMTDFLFLSLNVPEESEYPRIHAQMKMLFTQYLQSRVSDDDYNFYHLLNDVRFGSFDMHDLRLSNFDRKKISILAKAALLANKQSLFLEIYDSLEGRNFDILNEIAEMISGKRHNIPKKNFKVIFDIISTKTEAFAEENNKYLLLLKEFYALHHFNMVHAFVSFEFVALEDLVKLDFPPVISTGNMRMRNNLPNDFVEKIFFHMKVFNEDTVISVLSDYDHNRAFKRNHRVPFELIELISKSTKLKEAFAEKEINLSLGDSNDIRKFSRHFIGRPAGDVEKYLDLPLFQENSPIVSHFNTCVRQIIDVSDYKSKKQFGNSVAQFYFYAEARKMRNNREMTELDYPAWRLVFSHWIKSEEKERLREIQSPDIIRCLRLEFVDEMNELLG